MTRGETLDLERLRRLTRQDDQWVNLVTSTAPVKRPQLIDHLNRLARQHAEPFRLGEFHHAADIAPLISLLVHVDWVNGPDARPRSHPPAGYGGEVLHLARGVGDTQTNQPDPIYGTVFDGLLELFFDWGLPLAYVNGTIRAAAMTTVKAAYATITGTPRTLINGQMKKLGGKDINAQLKPHLNDRASTVHLVAAWAGAAVPPAPDEDVMAAFWSKLYKIADNLDEAGYNAEANHLRRQVETLWRPPPPPDSTAPTSSRSRDIAVDNPETLDYLKQKEMQKHGRVESTSPNETPPSEDPRHSHVDDALEHLEQGPPDIEEYERAYRALTTLTAGASTAADPVAEDSDQEVHGREGDDNRHNKDITAGDGPDFDIDPDVAELALRCLAQAIEAKFTATKDVSRRDFIRAQLALTATASVDAVDAVDNAAAAIILKALQTRRQTRADGDGN